MIFHSEKASYPTDNTMGKQPRTHGGAGISRADDKFLQQNYAPYRGRLPSSKPGYKMLKRAKVRRMRDEAASVVKSAPSFNSSNGAAFARDEFDD